MEAIMKIKRFSRVLLLVLAFITLTGNLSAGELYDKVEANDIEAVKKLLAAGADINEKVEVAGAGTMTPLLIAVVYHYEEMAKMLISEGADINAKTATGQTPLMFACYNSEEIAMLLVSKGAEINVKDGTGAFTLCILAVMDESVPITLAEFLLSRGANVDETDSSGPMAGYTCLMMAAGNQKPELVKFLVKNGANINAKTKDGATPLNMAIRENDAVIIKLLKDFGAKE
jgi:ankyrin repeat protein